MRTIVYIALAWTGWLLLVTAIHWSAFDFERRQTWFWIVAYIAFPTVAGLLAGFAQNDEVPPDTRIAAAWIPRTFAALGALLVALAALLFIAPEQIALISPWKISSFLAQIYSGPVLGYGVGLLVLATRRNWPESVIPTIGLFTFAVLALIGSSWHLTTFTLGSPSLIAWFGGLTVLAILSALVLIQAARERKHT